MADPKLDDLLASHRRFAPRLSEDRLIQVIKERRAELAVPSNVRPEWKESILEIYVTEAQDRGMYVGNPRKKKAAQRKTKKKTAKKKAAKRKTKKKSSKKKSAKKKTLGTRVRTAAKKGEKAAKRGAKRAKKFAGTEEGYMTGGAMAGALVAGPIGAGLGLLGGKRLYKENPDGSRRMVSGRVPRSMSKTVRKRNANKHALEARAHIAHWQERQDPRSLIQALRSTALAEQEYRHAGVMGSDRVFGADPAAAQYDELRAQIMEILA
jgi:hypothetical protein